MKRTKFCDTNYEIFYAFYEKSTSARILVFHLGGQFARYFANVYVADFVNILGSCSEICWNIYDVAVFPFPAKYVVGADMYTN